MFDSHRAVYIACIVLNLVFAGLNFYGGSVFLGLINLFFAILMLFNY